MDDDRYYTGLMTNPDLIGTLMADLRRGCVQHGTVYVQPNSWAGNLVRPKSSTEVNVEAFIESCSFKTGTAGVMGMQMDASRCSRSRRMPV